MFYSKIITIIHNCQSLDERTPLKDEWIVNEMDENVLSKICPTEFMNVKDEGRCLNANLLIKFIDLYI